MKKITWKIIVVIFSIMILLATIVRLSMLVFGINDFQKVNMGLVFVMMIITMTVALTLFAVAINQIIVKRIQKVSIATKEVASGNFEIKIADKFKDEISTLANNFDKMTAELKANQYLSKNFVRNVSHEIKTPISAISGFAEMIENECQETEVKEYARIISSESARLAAMSKALLQLSLLDSTTIIKKDEIVQPAAQIRNIIANLQPEWENKNLNFDVDLSDKKISSNEQLLYQVWQNLISNAIKFSKVGGTIFIRLTTNQKLEFVITDEGEGINLEDQEKIFNQFFVADKTRNQKGSGLGLSITKTILDKLNGTICFESKKASGTQFKVLFNL